MFLSACTLLVGCEACSEERAVPFKRGSHVAAAPGAEDAGRVAVPEFQPTDGRQHSEGETRLVAGGAILDVSPARLHTSLSLDLDADGDLDLLVITSEGEAAPELSVAEHRDDAFAKPSVLAKLADDDCTLDAYALRAFSPAYVSLWADADCPTDEEAAATGPQAAPDPAGVVDQAPPVPENQLDDGAARAGLERRLWILTLEQRPRVIEQLAVLPPSDERARVAVELETAYLDEDRHPDVRLQLAIQPPGDPTTRRLALGFFNRPGGLSRDPAEPEATLRSLANEARVRLKRDATQAVAEARHVIGVHAALCREGGAAALRFGPTPGLDCGASLGAGRATSVALAGLAEEGRVFDAMALEAALEGPGHTLTDSDRTRAQRALAAMTRLEGLRWRRGPEHQAGRAPRVHRSALAFENEHVLRLRGRAVSSHDLSDGSTTPAGLKDSLLMTDASGTLAVVEVFRSCRGHHLRIVGANQVVAGVTAGAPRAEPLIAPRPAPAGARCPELPPALASDDGGYRPLAWTRDGVLLSRNGELLLLALDGDGQAQSPARPVTADSTPALPPLLGAATPDLAHHALTTRLGLALVDRGRGKTRLLPPPAGVEAQAITDVALSPSGQRLAILAGSQVWIAEPGATGAPADAPDLPAKPPTAPPDKPPVPTGAAPATPSPKPPHDKAADAPSPEPT